MKHKLLPKVGVAKYWWVPQMVNELAYYTLMMFSLGLQQRFDKIDKNLLLKALAKNLVIDSLGRAINKLLVGAALFTASRQQVGS
jgi:hypothetical protein